MLCILFVLRRDNLRISHPLSLHDTLRLRRPRRGQYLLSNPHICHRVRLALRWESPIGSPKINQRLHRLQLMRLQKIQRRGRQYEMAEAAVQLLLQVEMIKRIGKVGVVEMRIDAKHLQENGLADAAKLFGEARALAEPFSIGGRGGLRGEGWVESIRDARGVRGENFRVVDFTGYPSLHEGDVLIGGQLDRFVATVEPGVGVITGSIISQLISFAKLCRTWHSRASAHLWASGRIADTCTTVLLLINHPDKMPQIPVVLNTLVRYPLAGLYRLGPRDERHEVAFDNVLGVCWVDPCRQGQR